MILYNMILLLSTDDGETPNFGAVEIHVPTSVGSEI
jgi:hypothetical protein